jgi:integrase/recombinase XerD
MNSYVIDYWKELYLTNKAQKLVTEIKQRNYALRIAKFWLGERKQTMPKQAKTLTQQNLKQVLDYVAIHKHALRNRTMLLCTHYAGMRVGEIVNLKYTDVMDEVGQIREEIVLKAEQTKGRHGRTVFVNTKLRRELEIYVRNHKPTNSTSSLFYTQKQQTKGFTPNTLAQYFHYLYKRAGITGGSSHSGRRTFITNLAAKGIGVKVLMELAGHHNIATTQRYIDVTDDMKRKAVELA